MNRTHRKLNLWPSMWMKNSHLRIFSLLLLVFGFIRTSEGDPIIDVTPTEFTVGVSASLDVNCSISMANTPSLAAIMSLIIERSNDLSGQSFTELAVINKFSPDKVNMMTVENILADGVFDDIGASFLHLRWNLPSEQQSGMYRCSAHGFDSIGHTSVLIATAQATARPGPTTTSVTSPQPSPNKAKGVPYITANPAEFTLGFSTSLEVNCSFAVGGNSILAAVVSLIIERSHNSGRTFTDLAAINKFTPDKVSVLTTTENFTVDGILNDAGESFLLLKWRFPLYEQAGLYKCSVHGYDSGGHAAVLNDTTQADSKASTLNRYMERITEISTFMEQTVAIGEYNESQECPGSTTGSYWSDLDQSVTEMNRFLKIVEQKVSAAENRTKTLEQKLSDMVKVTHTCEPRVFKNSMIYKGRAYCVSSSTPEDDYAGQRICEGFGGHLAEINDADEYHAIQAMLSNISGIIAVVMGGNDKYHEGQWEFNYPRDDEQPYLEWPPGEPSTEDGHDCLLMFLYDDQQWRMIANSCKNYVDTVRFMCEI